VTPALRTLLALSLCENYNHWIADACRPFLGYINIEVGCGIGNVMQHLGGNVVGMDVDEKRCALANALTNLPTFTASLTEPSKVLYNTVVCVNVLEHLPDDLAALKSIRSMLVPGGHLCLFVPAHPWLLGSVDRAVGHYRRYTMAGLRSKMVDAGFTVTEMHWFNPVGILGWAANNLLRREHPSLWNVMIFDKAVPILRLWQRPFTGLSIFAVGEKREA
jgi:SAM-dependent methyltransferase